MKHIGFFLIATSCLGIVTGCDETAKTKCIQEKKTAATKGSNSQERCGIIRTVGDCITDTASCSKEDGDNAFNQLQKDLQLDCDNEGVDDEAQCQQTSEECEQAIENKRNENPILCRDVEVYGICIIEDCKDISKRVEEIMNKEKLQCPDIWAHMCKSKNEMKLCEETFNATLVELDLKERTETKCGLAAGLLRCIEKRGKCALQTAQVTLRRALEGTDCSEYVDLCSHTMEESCSMIYANTKKNRCEKLKDLQKCLRTQSFCPQGHIHVTMRRVMRDESFDCSDVNACNEIKEESCTSDVFTNILDTKEDKCRRFKTFKSCMVAAQCNDLYQEVKVTRVDKLLNSPCDGTSAMLASIVLTLLLAVFTSLWK